MSDRNFSEMTQEEIEEELERKRKVRNEKRAIKIRKKCATRPQVLKTWIVEVEQFGKGEVVDYRKAGLGHSTEVKVAFEEGVKWVCLDRKETGKKGRFPFQIKEKSGMLGIQNIILRWLNPLVLCACRQSVAFQERVSS
jgi:hypothetical protein